VLKRIRNGERMPTVAELAAQYPHSRATVNRALRSLAEQGYLRLDRGRGIHLQQSHQILRIGLLVGPSLLETPTQPFAALLARGAREFFDARGIEHRLYIERPELLREGIPCKNLRRDLEAEWLHGLITAQCNAPGSFHYSALWRRRALPLVNIGTHHRVAHHVSTRPEAALRLALEVVRERGGRRVAVFGSGAPSEKRARALLEGYGLEAEEEWFARTGRGVGPEEQGYLNTQLLWSRPRRPDSLVVLDDVLAKGVMQALLELGVRVPEELHLVHHANRGSGIFYPISAPRVEYEPTDFIERAADLVLALVAEPSLSPKSEAVEPRLRLEDGSIRQEVAAG
jgi:DNA-binding LacI/PurR family transcriptional regulator